MPKKAVAIYLLLALLGAVIFIFITFPRTREEIPKSNNQIPFPSAPGPNNMPPHPSVPNAPHGPTLRIMAWAAPSEAAALSARADAYSAQTGQGASLTVVNDEATYRHDLREALASDTPPDLCLIEARDFSGADASRDFADATPESGVAPRSIAAFTVGDRVKALPAEFSVDVLYYNPAQFDRAGIAYPGAHWNWDVLQAMSRALSSLKMKTAQGEPIYPLELPANFDFWNMLCAQAGHPALDVGVWHLADSDSKEAEMRSLDFIHTFFQGLAVAAPLPRAGVAPGGYFARQEAAMLIAPSELTASLPHFDYRLTVLPRDMRAGSLARVNGWAVTAQTKQPEAARSLAIFLARQPIHAGWSGVIENPQATGNAAICWTALGGAIIPRLVAKDLPMAQFLDQQIDQLARHSGGDAGRLYALIQSEYQSGQAPQQIESGLPKPAEKLKPRAPSAAALRDM